MFTMFFPPLSLFSQQSLTVAFSVPLTVLFLIFSRRLLTRDAATVYSIFASRVFPELVDRFNFFTLTAFLEVYFKPRLVDIAE